MLGASGAALNERDIDRYLAGCTEDIEVRTQFVPFPGSTKVRMTFGATSPTSRTRVPTSGSNSNTWGASSNSGARFLSRYPARIVEGVTITI
jgi:hypothetical protein